MDMEVGDTKILNMWYLVSQFFKIDFKMELQLAAYQVVKLRESRPSRPAWKILNLECSAK